MEFKLTTTKDVYDIKDDKEEIDALKKLGFEFEKYDYPELNRYEKIKSNTINLKSLEDLIEFIERCNYSIVMDLSSIEGGNPTIEIYNDYRE